MKNFIFLWACLAIINATTLQATDTDSTSVITHSSKLESEKPTTETESKAELVVFIPNRTLELQLVPDKDLLLVNLSGYDGEVLDWMIFKPKAEVKSRISTTDLIDEIKINKLDPGKYIIMIKDQQGRILHQSFTKA